MRILLKNEVAERTGYSAAHLWRLENAGEFPRRVQLGPNRVGWLEHEIDAWIKKRADARPRVTVKPRKPTAKAAPAAPRGRGRRAAAASS